MSRPPVRQVIRVEAPGFVGALVQPVEGCSWTLLHQRQGSGPFDRVPQWRPVQPGDVVVAHLVDPTRPAELERANALYSNAWYAADEVLAESYPWPDERRMVAEWVPEEGARVLDTCCGSGRLTPALVRSGNRVVGVDQAGRALAVARADAPPEVAYTRGDARRLPFPDRCFDAVTCVENSLGEFLVDPLVPVAEMIRVCRDGGDVLLGVRDADDPWVSWSPEGFVHVGRTWPEPRRDQLCEAIDEVFPRVARVEVRPGDERPWGGRMFHLRVALG